MPHLHRRTRRLEVRPFKLSDHRAWREAYLTMPPPKNVWDRQPRAADELTVKKFRETLKGQKDRRDRDYVYDLGVFLQDGTLIGGVSIMEVARGISQTAFFGYGIFNPYWGKGYAKEAVRALLDIGFKDLKLHRLEAGIEPENRLSIHLARAVGLRLEGRKKRALFLRNRWVDLMIYTATCEDLGLRFRGPKPQIVART